MAKEAPALITIAGHPVSIQLNKVLDEQRNALEDKVLDVRKELSPYVKYPYEPGETTEEWEKRLGEELNLESKRGEDESKEDHATRMFELNFSPKENRLKLLGILNAVSSTFCNKEFTMEEMGKANYTGLKNFLFDVLTYFDIPANDLRVRKPGN